MTRLTNLREFQESLTRRIHSETVAPTTLGTRLGFQAGADAWLIRLDEAAEVIAVGTMAPVPLTRPWYRGLTNVRGNLYSVVDLGHFTGAEPNPQSIDARLLLVNERFNVNVALLVTRMFGLRVLGQMRPEEGTHAPWVSGAYRDAEGRRWFELSVPDLIYHPDFLNAGI